MGNNHRHPHWAIILPQQRIRASEQLPVHARFSSIANNTYGVGNLKDPNVACEGDGQLWSAPKCGKFYNSFVVSKIMA